MGTARKLLAALVALMVLAPLTPTSALPPGPPVVALEADQNGDTFFLTGHASEPDGAIVELSICVEGGACEGRVETAPGLDLQTCLTGDAETIEIEHTFPGPGLYTITVAATGTGCPIVGRRETVEETFAIIIHEPPPPPVPHEAIECATGGTPTATAPGVTEDAVTIAATIPATGPEGHRQGDVRAAMSAAVRVINQLEGVCGRLLDLMTLDDGGETHRRRQFVKNFHESGDVFALVGQEVAGVAQGIENNSFPAVGSFSRARAEFDGSWIWPIRAGNDAFGWIAADHAYAQGARRFGIVYDQSTPTGTETREALEAALARYDDATLVAPAPVYPARGSYAAEAQVFNEACNQSCDAVLYATDGHTLLTWMAGGAQRGTMMDAAHPVLFGDDVAANCGIRCDGMVMFTDFHPPIGSTPGTVARYCDDLRAVDPTADCSNPHAQAAYAAVFTAARAMGAVGVDLTRDAFRDALDTVTFDLGLTGAALSWDHPRRHANRWLRTYSIVIAQGSFAGMRPESDWLEDPRG